MWLSRRGAEKPSVLDSHHLRVIHKRFIRWSPVTLKDRGTSSPPGFHPLHTNCPENLVWHGSICRIRGYHPPHNSFKRLVVAWIDHEGGSAEDLTTTGEIKTSRISPNWFILHLPTGGFWRPETLFAR